MTVFYWIYDIPTYQLAICMAVIFVGISWIGVILIRPLMRLFVLRRRDDTNDVVGYIISCFCVFYGLLLGLIAVAAYQNYADVEASVSNEAAALSALYQDVSVYQDPYGQNLRWHLRDFCRFTIRYGWPEYQQGRIPPGADVRLMAFHEQLLAFEPQTPAQEIVHAESLRQFNVFMEKHRIRQQAVSTGIPPIMWYVVLTGAVLNIMLVWLFDIDFLSHLALGGVLAFFLSTVILLIASMDNPFRGEVSIQPLPFETLYWEKMRE
jgi:hypothetical protein